MNPGDESRLKLRDSSILLLVALLTVWVCIATVALRKYFIATRSLNTQDSQLSLPSGRAQQLQHSPNWNLLRANAGRTPPTYSHDLIRLPSSPNLNVGVRNEVSGPRYRAIPTSADVGPSLPPPYTSPTMDEKTLATSPRDGRRNTRRMPPAGYGQGFWPEGNLFTSALPSDNRNRVPTPAMPETLPTPRLMEPNEASEFVETPSPNSNRMSTEERKKGLDPDDLLNRSAHSMLLGGKATTEVNLTDLIWASLQHSHQIQVQRLGVGVERTRVTEEVGQFDWNLFIDNAISDIRQPQNTNLGTAIDRRLFQGFLGNTGGGGAGGADLEQSSFQHRSGVRKITKTGGELSINYERSDQVSEDSLGVQEQSVDQLVLRVSHELLRGAGKEVTLNRVIQADIAAATSYEESLAEVSGLVQEIAENYWELLRARGEVLVRKSLLEEGIEVRRELQARKNIDAEEKLIARTTATIADRRASLTEAYRLLIDSQNQLLRLVNWNVLDVRRFEVYPTQVAVIDSEVHDLDAELGVAFQHRPEVRAALARIDAASRENRVSRKQLLPRLAFVLESRFFDIENQDGEGVSAGLNFELPFGNRTLRAQNRRAQLELARREVEYRDTIAQIESETRAAFNQVEVSQGILALREEQIEASERDLRYQEAKRRIAPDENSIPAFDLDQLLNAQQAVADAQIAFLEAATDLNVSLVELLRAKGLLVERLDFQAP